jgi:serine protein kinase
VAADPVHLLYVLEKSIKREQLGDDREERYLNYLKGELSPRYAEFLGNEIQKAYLESYNEYGQNLFDRYIEFADAWCQDHEFKDSDTGLLMDRSLLNDELEKIEKPAGIGNPKDFRNEVVQFCLRARANNEGKNPKWTSYSVLRDVIEKKMFSQVEDILPVISFEGKKDKEMERKHKDFIKRMEERGYTPKQIRRLVDWYLRVKKSS